MSIDKMSVPGDFEVIRYDLPAFAGDYTCMDYGDPLAPRTVQVREQYRLDDVVAGHPDEFAAQCALKRWVRSRWDHGWSLNADKVQDALDILQEADRGEQFNCGFYARVFIECARALGWVARPVGIGIRDIAFPRGHNMGNIGHSVSEIWSNQHRKWVLLDADMNMHYLRDSVPLSALELHDAWMADEADAVTVVAEEPAFVMPGERAVELANTTVSYMDAFTTERIAHNCRRFTRHNVLDYYARVGIGKWTWLDRRCLPSFVVHFAPGHTGILTDNRADMNWTVNMVRLGARADWSDGAKLIVTLEHCMPWFDRYEVCTDSGQWRSVGDTFDWPMREGVNTMEVRAVNVCGAAGIPARLEVAYAPPKW